MTPDPASFPPSRCGLVILAAGASRRMGSPKQLIEIDGRPLLVRAIEAALTAPVWPVVVVLGANADALRPLLARYPVLIAENPAWPEGMASSIRAGVTLLRQFSRALEGTVITVCDQPALAARHLTALLDAPRPSGRQMAAARWSCS